jgi:hypothetical protein
MRPDLLVGFSIMSQPARDADDKRPPFFRRPMP